MKLANAALHSMLKDRKGILVVERGIPAIPANTCLSEL